MIHNRNHNVPIAGVLLEKQNSQAVRKADSGCSRSETAAFRAGIVLLFFALFAFPASPAFGQSAGSPVISMTFAGEKITLYLSGSGGAVIDWGDGVRGTVTLIAGYIDTSDVRRSYEVSHSYKKYADGVNVKIEGNVTSLYCYKNRVTALDVSKNPGLVNLHCGFTGITSLDTSGNPALEMLDCWDTAITSLDVRGNPALTALTCGFTAITSLDVSNNPALFHLHCGDTGITSLDVSKNLALLFFYCRNTRMNAAALEALFAGLPDRRGEYATGEIECGGTTECGEKAHAIARAKGWVVEHR